MNTTAKRTAKTPGRQAKSNRRGTESAETTQRPLVRDVAIDQLQAEFERERDEYTHFDVQVWHGSLRWVTSERCVKENDASIVADLLTADGALARVVKFGALGCEFHVPE